MLTLIAAHDRNRAIGRGNTIPWNVPEDMRFFREATTGHPVIMGRKTWDSLPRKPLPNRTNVVLTRGQHGVRDGVIHTDIPGALGLMASSSSGKAFCIGGSEIYAAMLPHAHRLLLTTIDIEVEGADAYFPEIDPREWVTLRYIPLRNEGPRAQVIEMLRFVQDAPK